MLRERHLGGTIILADAHIATARRSAANRAPWPIWGHWAAILTVWRAAAKRAYRCRLSCLAMKTGRGV
jgi:hypothetical protein